MAGSIYKIERDGLEETCQLIVPLKHDCCNASAMDTYFHVMQLDEESSY